MLHERDPVQKLIDEAVIDEAEAQHDRGQQDLAVLFNNAFVKAFPKGR